MRTKNRFYTLLIALLAAVTMAACSGGSTASFLSGYDYDDLTQFIKLGEYKGIEYKKTEPVSDDDVKARIDEDLTQNAEETKIESGTVTENSIVNIDYVGSIDGVEFEGGTAQGAELDIANSNYIKGFAEGIVGHDVGETFDLHVTFPEDYGEEELNGRDAVFKTTINYMIEKKPAEYTDEWVKKNTEYKDKASYEAAVRKELEEEQAANIVLMKTCADPDMRPRYTAYSLSETAEGKAVVFRLFSDKDCTRQVKVYKDAEMTVELPSIPVGANGNTGLTNRTYFYCEPGTYYVKESRPVYVPVPRYATRYYYNIWRWVPSRDVTVSGNDHDVRWPEVTLAENEREGERAEGRTQGAELRILREEGVGLGAEFRQVDPGGVALDFPEVDPAGDGVLAHEVDLVLAILQPRFRKPPLQNEI